VCTDASCSRQISSQGHFFDGGAGDLAGQLNLDRLLRRVLDAVARVHIDLRRRDILVAQRVPHLLYGRSVLQRHGGKRMTQGVRGHSGTVDTNAHEPFLDIHAKRLRAEPRPSIRPGMRNKEGAARVTTTACSQVPCNGLVRFAREHDEVILAFLALAADIQEGSVGALADVAHVRPDHLHCAESGPQHEVDHRVVAHADEV